MWLSCGFLLLLDVGRSLGGSLKTIFHVAVKRNVSCGSFKNVFVSCGSLKNNFVSCGSLNKMFHVAVKQNKCFMWQFKKEHVADCANFGANLDKLKTSLGQLGTCLGLAGVINRSEVGAK